MDRPIRKNYRYEKDKQGITVHYYFNIWPEGKKVGWGFHPALPEGMHWKKGDETGLGSDHSTSTQTFDEFIKKPSYEIPNEDYKQAIKTINEILSTN